MIKGRKRELMINGLEFYPAYITEEEEADILRNIERSKAIRTDARRNSIKRYGSNVPYKGKMVSEVIPFYLQQIAEKLVADGILTELPDSVTINEYKKGQGIDFHIDSKKSGPVIVVLSLLGTAVMVMKQKATHIHHEIHERELVVMRDEARTNWEHSVLPVEQDRISIVFRKSTL